MKFREYLNEGKKIKVPGTGDIVGGNDIQLSDNVIADWKKSMSQGKMFAVGLPSRYEFHPNRKPPGPAWASKRAPKTLEKFLGTSPIFYGN